MMIDGIQWCFPHPSGNAANLAVGTADIGILHRTIVQVLCPLNVLTHPPEILSFDKIIPFTDSGVG